MSIGGIELHEQVSGSGEPVVVLHGGFCSLESLAPIAGALAADHRVYAYERPGHGRSPDIPGEYTYERGLDDAIAYLDAHGLADAHVVGYSDGAIIGLLLAMRHPERVRTVTAISANLDPSAYDRDPEVNGPILPRCRDLLRQSSRERRIA
ncbi:alpha/beta fold hydrolase [Leucobacter sp. USCH14]|uniref:alpha/beta fold hydrolase n=1 Tax=Leucobacter sp. USCH14 TaxID=3024838 RepID=UPI0030A6105F